MLVVDYVCVVYFLFIYQQVKHIFVLYVVHFPTSLFQVVVDWSNAIKSLQKIESAVNILQYRCFWFSAINTISFYKHGIYFKRCFDTPTQVIFMIDCIVKSEAVTFARGRFPFFVMHTSLNNITIWVAYNIRQYFFDT